MKTLFFALSLIVLNASGSYASPEPCPPGFTDTGSHCTKPPPYGRGFGYHSSDRCEEKTLSSCEKCLSLWYPVCLEGYSPSGCNLCSPTCPANMTDVGLSCQK